MSDTCVLCCETIDASEMIKLDCKHVFHTKCLSYQISMGDTRCGLCRQIFTEEDRKHIPLVDPSSRAEEEFAAIKAEQEALALEDASIGKMCCPGISEDYIAAYRPRMTEFLTQKAAAYFEVVQQMGIPEDTKLQAQRMAAMNDQCDANKATYEALRALIDEKHTRLTELEGMIRDAPREAPRETPTHPIEQFRGEFTTVNLQIDYYLAEIENAFSRLTLSQLFLQNNGPTPSEKAEIDSFHHFEKNEGEPSMAKALDNMKRTSDMVKIGRGMWQNYFSVAVHNYIAAQEAARFESEAYRVEAGEAAIIQLRTPRGIIQSPQATPGGLTMNIHYSVSPSEPTPRQRLWFSSDTPSDSPPTADRAFRYSEPISGEASPLSARDGENLIGAFESPADNSSISDASHGTEIGREELLDAFNESQFTSPPPPPPSSSSSSPSPPPPGLGGKRKTRKTRKRRKTRRRYTKRT
jgi:hypothetical protein